MLNTLKCDRDACYHFHWNLNRGTWDILTQWSSLGPPIRYMAVRYESKHMLAVKFTRITQNYVYLLRTLALCDSNRLAACAVFKQVWCRGNHILNLTSSCPQNFLFRSDFVTIKISYHGTMCKKGSCVVTKKTVC